jgi:hypothetical protein
MLTYKLLYKQTLPFLVWPTRVVTYCLCYCVANTSNQLSDTSHPKLPTRLTILRNRTTSHCHCRVHIGYDSTASGSQD